MRICTSVGSFRAGELAEECLHFRCFALTDQRGSVVELASEVRVHDGDEQRDREAADLDVVEVRSLDRCQRTDRRRTARQHLRQLWVDLAFVRADVATLSLGHAGASVWSEAGETQDFDVLHDCSLVVCSKRIYYNT